MPRPQEVVTVRVKVWFVGDRAVRVEQGAKRDIWIPASQIADPLIDDLVVGELNDVTIPRWLADNEGLDAD